MIKSIPKISLISETGAKYKAKGDGKKKAGKVRTHDNKKRQPRSVLSILKTPYFVETMATATMTPEVPPESTWWLSRGE